MAERRSGLRMSEPPAMSCGEVAEIFKNLISTILRRCCR
jgi:hypothetical protein